MTSLAELRRRRAEAEATPTCDRCHQPIRQVVIRDTGERRIVDAEPVRVVPWSELEQLGADRGIEDHEIRGYATPDGRTVVGLLVATETLPDVRRVPAHTNHLQTCPERNVRPWRMGTR